MAFNIFERWPWTSFQNLNLDWLMKAVKEAVSTAEEAAESVGQFDARITENAADIEALQQALANVKGAFRIFVNNNRDALHDGQYIKGAEIYAALQAGQLPYLEYAGESYVPETWTSAGDMRFYTIHVDQLNTATMRRILVPAQSYNCAYSIVNLGGGSSSDDVFTVIFTEQSGNYVSDHTYNEIVSQMAAGRAPVLLVQYGSSTYSVAGNAVMINQSVRFYEAPIINTNGTVTVAAWYINSSNSVGHYPSLAQLASIDTIESMAVLFTPQTLTEEQKAQARTNIGAGTGGGTTEGIPVITNTESTLQLSIDPNKFYIFPNAGQLSISFTAGMAGVVNEYHFRFTSGSTATQLDLPATVQIPDDFAVDPDTVYEVSIIDNYMVYASWAVTV